MKAEIIAVGTELLMGHVVNTNAAEIAQMLAELGIGVYHQTVVGDNHDRLQAAVSAAADRVDLVVLTGGLGPTEDDLTRETVAEVLGLPLKRNEAWAHHLQELFVSRGWARRHAFPQNNFRQAMVPDGAELLPNSRGTAPGIFLTSRGTTFALVPGPPGEMRGLMREQVLPRLASLISEEGNEAVLVSRVLRVIGVGESRAAELLKEILDNQTNPTIAPLAHLGEMTFRLTAHSTDRTEAERLIDEAAARIYDILGDAIYGEDDATLEEVVGRLLLERNMTAATAESCTGGLIGDRLTNVPGSSRYFLGGVVAYSNDVKVSHLGVSDEVILRDGAVSESVAAAMARGACAAFHSDVGIAVTGIAGPDGGSEEKPVGLTWIAVAAPAPEGGPAVTCRRYHFPGDRREIKERAAHAALALAREVLRELPAVVAGAAGDAQ